MSGQYDDIIRLPHPDSSKHPRMSLYDRAAQFSPFAALTGHSAAIAETGRLTDQRMELDEYEMARVDAELQRLQELLPGRPTASITYFVPDERKNGGSYQTVTGEVKRIDAVNGVIQMTDRQCIPIADVSALRSSRKNTITKTPKPICKNGLGSFHYHSNKIKERGGIRMNPNADYLGIVTMLRSLREQGLVSGSEAKKIAARLRVQLGADIIISL